MEQTELSYGFLRVFAPSDIRGEESCLVYGDTPDDVPVHIVCGKNSQNHLFIITVYIPKMPKCLNPRVRNR